MTTFSHPVIFFDGVCNLCNNTVQFVIKRDKEQRFRFASLQGEAGQAMLQQNQLPHGHFNSFILYENGQAYFRSTAALKMLSQLKGWKWTRIFMLVPRFLRDGVYNLVARNRYRWFGKKDACMIPTPDLKSRFLE
jgi:predicted DCC family thiol-disulfide oxidoreductase YuxK